MGNPLVEVLIIFILLLLNGIFAMSEIAIVSARKGRLQEMAEESALDTRTRNKARIALELDERTRTISSRPSRSGSRWLVSWLALLVGRRLPRSWQFRSPASPD